MLNVLTKKQVNDYNTNGFIHPVPVISAIKADYYAKKLLYFQNNNPENPVILSKRPNSSIYL